MVLGRPAFPFGAKGLFSGASFHHDIVMLFSFKKNAGIRLLYPQIP